MLHTSFQGNLPGGSGEDFLSFLIETGLVVSEEKSFKDIGGRQMTNGQQRLPSYKLLRSPWLRGANNYQILTLPVPLQCNDAPAVQCWRPTMDLHCLPIHQKSFKKYDENEMAYIFL